MSESGDPTACAPVTRVTPAGADWLASASRFPRSVHALWALRPGAPSVLPCGTAFDVVSTPVLYGRRLLERLWANGPGSGPVAVHRSRLLLFTTPGSADRLLALLRWEEWDRAGRPGDGQGGERPEETIPPLLCHGAGDTVTVPPLLPDPAPRPAAGPDPADTTTDPDVGALTGLPAVAAAISAPGGPHAPGAPSDAAPAGDSRWLVAPGVRRPWLPGAEVLLWAHVRVRRDDAAARAAREHGHRHGHGRAYGTGHAYGDGGREPDAGRGGDGGAKPIFAPRDRGAKVYDVSRRR
ncbi:bifunctional DNA primase/polymerase [Streptomyces sp. Z26]|uniref:bifunctional DNA primase/polymerase n=1 Tax=Streptomyces sp. Z26 TaxID=2500177 RepID=UPI001404398B|nr:bifunctional DNA primase/polymerase [Streptomyces sp. Z26]